MCSTPPSSLPPPHDQGTDAVGIAERHDAVADDQRHDRVSTPATTVDGGHGGKDRLRRETLDVLALQLVSEHVQQRLGVGARVQVPPVLLDQQLLQFVGIGEVAVVGQADAVGGIHVEGLGLGRIQRACRGVPAVTDADVAPQFLHVPLLEDVTDQAVLLAGAERAVRVGHDAGGVLPAVLEDGQRIIDGLIDRPMADDADDATHVRAGLLVGWPAALPPRPAAQPRLRPHTVAAWTRATKARPQNPPRSRARTRIPGQHDAPGYPEQHAQDPVRARDDAPADEIGDDPGHDAAGEQHADEQRQASRPELPERIIEHAGEQTRGLAPKRAAHQSAVTQMTRESASRIRPRRTPTRPDTSSMPSRT